jgi:class 3 adenylate cyclase
MPRSSRTQVQVWKKLVPDIPLARLVITKQRVHVADLRQEATYKAGFAPLVALVDKGGARTLLIVPMLKERTLVGAIALYRQEVRPFTDKQIALVESFADQAVIAIENARLLRELHERTEDAVKLNQQLEHRVADQVGEIERMSRLRRFLPPQVADLIVASGSEKQLESHRREITALFCDLRGFTGFTESADAEDVIALLRDYHAVIGEIIIKYNGTLERYAGDGVMVVFNDPVPVENPALQAVLMALELRNALGALTQTWSRLGHEIGFGIGIAHGFATLGTIGYEGRFDYAAIGTVSNVASRLCDEAKPGQILISVRVLMKVENAVKVEPVGEFGLSGGPWLLITSSVQLNPFARGLTQSSGIAKPWSAPSEWARREMAGRLRCYVNEASLKSQVSRLAHRHRSRRYSKGLVYQPARARSAANARAAKDFLLIRRRTRGRGRAPARSHADCLRIIKARKCGWRMPGIYLRESLTASSPA